MARNQAELLTHVQSGERRALARAITLVEKGGHSADELMEHLASNNHHARRIGITGPPGAGKSTLCARIAEDLSKQGRSVGILAIDPTSPFTDGAVLGDRIRMLELNDDIYIRSLASRGNGGGLGSHTDNVLEVLDAAGFDDILLETVGIGQAEVAVRPLVDTLMLVLVPESGDSIQAIKAGIMEIADLYVMNKCDRPESQTALHAIQTSLFSQHHLDPRWKARAIAVSALNNEGIDKLIDELGRHTDHIRHTGVGEHKLRERLATRLCRLIEDTIKREIHEKLDKASIDMAIHEIINDDKSVHTKAREILEKISNGG